MTDAFENLNKKFNTESFETKLTEIDHQLETVKQKKNELVNTINDNNVILTKEDQNYLIKEVKDSLEQVDIVLKNVAIDTRIGTPATVLEAYSKILNAKANLMRELREIYRSIMDMQIFNPESSINKPKDNEVSMTATALLKLIKSAQKDSSLNKIDAKFEIIEREEDDDKNNSSRLFKDKPKDKK